MACPCVPQVKVLFILNPADLILTAAALMPPAIKWSTFGGKTNPFAQSDALTAAGEGRTGSALPGRC